MLDLKNFFKIHFDTQKISDENLRKLTCKGLSPIIQAGFMPILSQTQRPLTRIISVLLRMKIRRLL